MAETKGLESKEIDRKLAELGQQYENLPESYRLNGGVVRSWEEVLTAAPGIPHLLESIKDLTKPRIYSLNEEGQLLIGDGCGEPPKRNFRTHIQ